MGAVSCDYTGHPMSFQHGVAACFSVAILSTAVPVFGQAPSQSPKAPAPPPVEKIREGVYRISTIEVDTLKKEARVAATVNGDVTTLEWVANTKGGAKAYESALTVDTNATAFNAALLLLGLDPTHARVPTRHFDPNPPQGDPVEIWVEWSQGTTTRRVRIEQFLYDDRTKATLPFGPWVYTGSTFTSGRYQADLDGVLIGFVHSPSPVIENPRPGAVDAYGSITMNNRRLNVAAGQAVTLIVRSLGSAAKDRK